MFSLKVKSTKLDAMNCVNNIQQTISVKNEIDANAWLDAIASHSTILEVSLEEIK